MNVPDQFAGGQKTDFVGFHGGFDFGRLREKRSW
jgi:hypothetical protein